MKYPRTVGILADLHCGSIWALTPPSWWNDHTLDAVKWMWKCSVALCKAWPKKINLLILNADLCDGKQYRSAGTGLITASIGEQVEIAIECLRPFADKADKIIRTEGTGYHETFEGPLAALDKEFGITAPPLDERIVRDIQLDNGAVLNVKHKPEGEGTLYRGTALDREVLWAAITEYQKRLPHATHLIRSHLHSTAHLRGFGKEINFTPGWCLQPPYAQHKRYYRWIPDIGGTLITADPLGFKGYRVVTTTFDLPMRKACSYADL
jgi:hypothetical protein